MLRKKRWLVSMTVILSMIFLNFACTTRQHIAWIEPSHIASQFKPGDKIECRTVDGEIIQLKVMTVNSEIIKGTSRGQDKTIKITDIESIERKNISAGKTTGLVLGVIAFVVVIAGIKNLDLAVWPAP